MGGVVAIRVKIAGNEERLDPFEFLCKRPGRSGRHRLQVQVQPVATSPSLKDINWNHLLGLDGYLVIWWITHGQSHGPVHI